jgi:D-aminopeptidase
MSGRRRARDWGLPFEGEPGAGNAITDVPGVEVGSVTRIEGDGELRVGHGPVRTGVTVIFPCGRKRPDRSVWAGSFAFNGNGEMTGQHWVRDAGHFAGPVALTNTHAVGMVHHGLTRWMVQHVASLRQEHQWYMPVVAETYDGLNNDINGLHLGEADVLAALDSARGGAVAEGNVGGGTGMMCYEFKGGTGTASRRVHIAERDYSVGVLLQANFGARDELSVCGVPVGRLWPRPGPLSALGDAETGSCIVIVATDAPLHPLQLQRLARRASLGLARTGTSGGVHSGDLMLAFSVAGTRRWSSASGFAGPAVKSLRFLEDHLNDALSRAAVQATEEAVINALLAADGMDTLKPGGLHIEALEPRQLLRLMRAWRPLGSVLQ